LAAAKDLGVKSDGEGLDYFLTDADKMHIPNEKYSVLVVADLISPKRSDKKTAGDLFEVVRKNCYSGRKR